MRHSAVVSCVSLLVALLAGCDDPNAFRIDPLLTTDTVEIAAPTPGSTLPTVLDITASAGVIAGGRNPERLSDAEQWDLAVRQRSGETVFLPAGALGLNNPPPFGGRSRAAITKPITDRSFDEVVEAPGRTGFVTDSAVVIQAGGVYVARSRLTNCGFSGGEQYAKLRVLELNRASGRVRLQITTNERCSDPRLAEEG